jgi:4-aminobutyrate---pyruvate transaminase
MERPNSAARRDIAYHLHPYTNLKRQESEGPLVIASGKGVRITDDSGREYIEGMSGLWCASLGFGEERLVAAAAEQMRRLSFYHGFNQKAHEPAGALAERLIAMMPVPMSKVFFSNSGSEANDTAVKMVWYTNNALGRPRKKKIIARMRGYHGVTVAAASLTGLANNHRDFDLPIANIRHADCPHHWRYAHAGESEAAYADRLAERLEAQILREDPDTVAAFIAEPVMGAGGVIVPPETYFPKIQAVLRKYDVLLIADEVICGFGRTGAMFGSETFAIVPDIITVAKALSSAYLPISATIVSEPIYRALAAQSEKLGVFAHGFTYGGHPVCCAVALETLKLYEERNILGHIRAVAPVLQQGVRRFADHPLVGEVRGVGLMAGIELVRDKKTKAAFPAAAGVGALVQAKCQERGVMLRSLGDTIGFAPPFVITEGEIGELLDGFAQGLAAATDELARRGDAMST